jgi:hypothetical protein
MSSPVNSRDKLRTLLDHYDEEHSSFREDLLRKISSTSVPMTILNSLVSALGSLGFDTSGVPPGPKHCARCHETYEGNGPGACSVSHEWEEEGEFFPKSVDGHFSKRWVACKSCSAELSYDGNDFLNGKECCFEGYHTQEHDEQFEEITEAIECRERGCPLDKLDDEDDEDDDDDDDDDDEEMA